MLHNLLNNPLALLALFVFVLSYFLVLMEEFTQLKKSKPVLLSAGFIWAIAAFLGMQHGESAIVNVALNHAILEFSQLFLFLLVAMTYVNTMEERQVFNALSSWLTRQQWGYRQLFWITGFISFFLSPFLDNLTTALIMGAVVMAVGINSPTFVCVGCINIVVAANAGGAFTPFGDVTTLMIWQYGVIDFFGFLAIFVPALVSYLIPAFCMHWAVPKTMPEKNKLDKVKLRPGAKRVIFLFILTIFTAVVFHQLLDLPAMLGMTTGLSYLTLLGYFLNKREFNASIPNPFDIFKKIEKIEWDTLLFFYGIMLSIAGLGVLGYLSLVADNLYIDGNFSVANTLMGILSAILGNIPVLYTLLTMNLSMSEGQWLLLTLTTGIGGNLLAMGSAAGIALMGQSGGRYTFFKHLRWTWAIALGYFVAIALHLWINKDLL